MIPGGGGRKGIRPQVLLYHTTMQEDTPVLIPEKKQVISRFLTQYNRQLCLTKTKTRASLSSTPALNAKHCSSPMTAVVRFSVGSARAIAINTVSSMVGEI